MTTSIYFITVYLTSTKLITVIIILFITHISKRNGVEALHHTAWILAKQYGNTNNGEPDFKLAYNEFTYLLSSELHIKKTTRTFGDTGKKTTVNVYLKIETPSIDSDTTYSEPSEFDNYAELDKTDVLILKEYLKKKLTKSQYRYIEEYLQGNHSFTVNPIYKRIRHILKTDDLLKYIKID